MITYRLAQRTAIIFFTMLLGGTGVHAQVSEKNDFEQRSVRKDQTLIQYQQNLQNVKIAVMDGPIDPAEYIVGPGDVYSVNVWSSPPVGLQLAVTPEGSIIFPSIGEVQVAGLHLDEAKTKVISTIRKKYISGDVSFTLVTPRMFAVTVRGMVQNEGTVYVQANERVDAAITLANSSDTKFLKNEAAAEQKRGLAGKGMVKRDTTGSLRKIIIRHKNGSEGTADLEKYFVQKESRYNPILQDGDIVVVPRQNIDRDFIGVYGAVNGDGGYEFVPGDSLFTMLKIARGLTSLADSDQVEVIRSDDSGNFLKTIRPDLRAISSRRSEDFPLQRGDRIVVREKPELYRDYKVYIEGEVLYPGYYPISRDSATLSGLVQKAGGFKELASLSASQLLRRAKTSKEMDVERLENARGASSQEDSIYYRFESDLRLKGELVVADFVGLFLNNDKSKEVYLQDGDRIVIAARTKTVYVFGQVVQPGHVSYLKDQNYKYYTNRAGGLTEDAVKSDIRVIKAGTKQWLDPDETTIEEGDYLWVPKEPYRPFTYYMQTYSQFFSILGTIATLALLAIQAGK